MLLTFSKHTDFLYDDLSLIWFSSNSLLLKISLSTLLLVVLFYFNFPSIRACTDLGHYIMCLKSDNLVMYVFEEPIVCFLDYLQYCQESSSIPKIKSINILSILLLQSLNFPFFGHISFAPSHPTQPIYSQLSYSAGPFPVILHDQWAPGPPPPHVP